MKRKETTSPRIPIALQQVFIASQRGEVVNEAPEKSIGQKVFAKNRGFTNLPRITMPVGFVRRWRGPVSDEPKQKKSKDKTARPTIISAPRLKSIRDVFVAQDEEVTLTKEVKPEPPKAPKFKPMEDTKPQDFLDGLVSERGYSTETYNSLQTGYYCKPTPFQLASYGNATLQAVRSSDAPKLRKLLGAGLSSNPCNAFGESLVHTAARRGDADIFKVFEDAGCSIQVTDDYGRTPLHDACWRSPPSLEVIEMIAARDVKLWHIKDCRGSTPLDYVKDKNDWKAVNEFLDSKKDIWWKPRSSDDADNNGPDLLRAAPQSNPIPDSDNALPIELVKLVAAGKMEPEEALFMANNEDESDDESDYDSEEDDDSEYDSDYDSDYDSEDDYSDSFNDEDMDLLQQCCATKKAILQAASRV